MGHINLEIKEPVKSILISQPKPSDDKSPYHKLAEKFSLDIEFRPFIKVEGLSYKDFRKQKVEILEHSAIIFTSRNAVDNFFRICKEGKIEVPVEMKYFCINEQTAFYLQKYITIRKRKLFVGSKAAKELIEIIKKHSAEKFLYPCSDIRKEDIPAYLKENGYTFTEATFYRTVSNDLTDIKEITYDMIAFFSPSGVKSLFVNFPAFNQNNVRIAAFGPTTAQAVRDAGLRLDIEAPHPNAPSMTGAIELYLKEVNK